MTFSSLLSHRITSYRNLPNGIGIQKTMQAHLNSIPCMIQPLSAEYAAKVNEVFGRGYNLFVPLGTDIQITDKLVDQDGKKYRVSGSQKRNYGASAPHLTFIISEEVIATPDQ